MSEILVSMDKETEEDKQEMSQEEEKFEPQPPASTAQSAPPKFDPSRMIGIIRRKALIKDLAAAYHAECLAYCQELLELQKKQDELFLDMKTHEDSRKDTIKPSKRTKKSR